MLEENEIILLKFNQRGQPTWPTNMTNQRGQPYVYVYMCIYVCVCMCVYVYKGEHDPNLQVFSGFPLVEGLLSIFSWISCTFF